MSALCLPAYRAPVGLSPKMPQNRRANDDPTDWGATASGAIRAATARPSCSMSHLSVGRIVWIARVRACDWYWWSPWCQ
jgi:hypothetical protein